MEPAQVKTKVTDIPTSETLPCPTHLTSNGNMKKNKCTIIIYNKLKTLQENRIRQPAGMDL
jgi:hypothetical protein